MRTGKQKATKPEYISRTAPSVMTEKAFIQMQAISTDDGTANSLIFKKPSTLQRTLAVG